MKIFNKYEAIGIFGSMGVMAIALFLYRFDTSLLAQFSNDQVATVAESEDLIEDRLTDSFSVSGKHVDLVIEDVRVGSGAAVEVGDTVEVHYEGRLQDGTRFDSSFERGVPFVFTVGEGKVIQGWEEGLVGMQVGGERILVIPPAKAYGNRQVSIIPPNSSLVFMVELIAIR